MDIRQITPRYSVSGQILPDELQDLAAAGVTVIINNRPDQEVPPELQGAAIKAAAEALGLTYVDNPVVPTALASDIGAAQHNAIAEASGKVHAYCASGMRSTVAWAMGEAAHQPVDDILAATAKAGVPLEGMRPTIEALSNI